MRPAAIVGIHISRKMARGEGSLVEIVARRARVFVAVAVQRRLGMDIGRAEKENGE